jgi:1-acyl-sn-glycerol-3-phosphate acyltransferase
MFHFLSKKIYYDLMNWKIVGSFPSIPKYVVAVVPHTSWLDFFVGIMVRSILRESINFVGKKELFTPLTAWIFRSLGGAPIDRSGNKNSVESIIAVFNAHQKFRIALAPEGTRRKVDKLRSGYYFIAKGLKIPIVPVSFDYENKKVVIHPNFYPSQNEQKDLDSLENIFKGVVGFDKKKSF